MGGFGDHGGDKVLHYVLLVGLGCGAGALGTLIGAGGGFVLVPLLLLLYPQESALAISSISLAVVLLNAASGTWAYAKMGRVDYRSGLLFAAATVPGAVAGALTVDYVPRLAFHAIFGVLMMAVAGYLLIRPRQRTHLRGSARAPLTVRRVVERDGATYTYAYNPRLGVGLSAAVGYVSSLLGIGAGSSTSPPWCACSTSRSTSPRRRRSSSWRSWPSWPRPCTSPGGTSPPTPRPGCWRWGWAASSEPRAAPGCPGGSAGSGSSGSWPWPWPSWGSAS